MDDLALIRRHHHDAPGVAASASSSASASGAWCAVFLAVRQGALCASLLSLLLITLDRWMSIHYPISYRARKSTRKALTAILLIWVVAFSSHFVTLALWNTVSGGGDDVSSPVSAAAAASVAAAPVRGNVTRNMMVTSAPATTVIAKGPVMGRNMLSCSLPFTGSFTFR